MSRLTVAAKSARGLRILILATAVVWTLAVGSSLLWGAAAVRRNAFEQELPRARLDSAAGPLPRREALALAAAVVRYDRLIAAGHLAVWLTGLGFVAFGGRWLLRLDRERDAAEKRLVREQETLRLLVGDLKRTEAELGRYAASLAEANRLKDLFTDVLSHDLLNPASASRYFAEQLRRGEVDPRRLRLIEAIERNLLRLTEMIHNASLYSRLEGTRESPVHVVDLGVVVQAVLAEQEPELAAAGISVEGPAPGSHTAAVHPMFANVVANLVGNAAKYAASGKRIACGIESAGPEWLLSVRDWGPGIAADGKGSVFTRFERLGKEGVQGSGLGLAIARRIVELQGGSIWVEDNPEGGSIFRVRVRKAAADDEPISVCQAPASTGMHCSAPSR
jgi:signal transduction histidine kinase